jgi:hypothetical protein
LGNLKDAEHIIIFIRLAMYYCEQSDDIYNHIPSKQTLFDELDRLTVHIAGEERKSSG